MQEVHNKVTTKDTGVEGVAFLFHIFFFFFFFFIFRFKIRPQTKQGRDRGLFPTSWAILAEGNMGGKEKVQNVSDKQQ